MNYLLTSVLCLANIQQKHLSKSALNEAEIDFFFTKRMLSGNTV